MTEPVFLVVDIETLDEAPPAALIELGWQSVQADADCPGGYRFGEMEGSMLFGIPEGQVMTAFNRSIHHIDPAELEELAPFDIDHFNGSALNDTTHVVAHNAEFEQAWLDFGLPWICTYKCALHAWPQFARHGNQALKYELGMEDAPELHPPHRALPDARVTAFILSKLLDEHDVDQLVEWSAQPRLVTKLPFGKHKGMLIGEAPADYLDWVASPKCEAADEALRYACRAELARRQRAQPTVAEVLDHGRYEREEGDR